jgi:glycosyltransferase involved in cell wall biosynthesis
MTPDVAVVHDYLTQRGGAERTVLAMLRAFPGAPLYTSLYEPGTTFEEFQRAQVHALPLNAFGTLRTHHRLCLPLLAQAFSNLVVEANVVLCSSSGWAHGAQVRGRKVVYCYTPARWLYQPERYRGAGNTLGRAALGVLGPLLLRWDRAAAATAHRYLTLSTVVRDRIRAAYGIEAEVLPPPSGIGPHGPQQEVRRLHPGFFLCVSRLLPYKNVGAVVDAFAGPLGDRLVVAGTGPEEQRLRAAAGRRVRFLGPVTNEELRWLYANCRAVVAASHEDYGLTPLEGAAFGKPSAVLRWGGFLDTVAEGTTGVFFDLPEPGAVQDALVRLRRTAWRPDVVRAHADGFSEARFAARLRKVLEQEAAIAAARL